MDVEPGHKMTEAGVIPSDWELRPLLSVVRIASGQVDPRIEPYRSMTLVAPDHIERATGRLLSKQTAADQRAISGKYVFSAGDIVYSKIRPYLRKAILASFDGLCSADMYPLKPAVDVAAGFLFAILLGHRFSKYAESVSVRSGMPKINRAELAEYNVALPPTKLEQAAIAGALSDADALIESIEQIIAKKRHLKQAAMLELLTGKRRLAGFVTRASYSQSEVGLVPSNWEVRRIGAVCKLINGRGFKPFEWQTTGLPIIRIQNLNGSDEFNYYTGTYDKKLEVEPGQLLFAWSGNRGTSFGPHIWQGPLGLLNYHTWKVQIHESEVSSEYFFHALKQLTGFIEGKAHGASALVHTQKWEMESFLIPLPPTKAEQRAIAAILSDMDTEIATLDAKLVKVRQIKQGMMQELLTGRTRLI